MEHQQSPAFSAKLTKWKNEPSLQILKEDLESAKLSHQTQVTKIDNWNDLLRVTGKHKPKKIKGRSSVQPKLARRQAEWRYSALSEPFLSSKKPFQIKPRTFEDAQSARQNEIMLNYQFSTKIDRVKFIDDYVHSVVDDGTCIVQVGWERKTVKLKKMVPVYTHYPVTTEEQVEVFTQALELSQSDPRTYKEQVAPEIQAAIDFYNESEVVNVAVQTGEEEVEFEKIIENKPTLDIRDPRNVIIDPTCNGDIEKAMFIIVSFETSKADLQKYPKRYKNLDKVNWEGTAPINEPDHSTNTPDTFQFKDAARKRVVAYEYWGYFDIEGDGDLTPFVATWIGDVLIRMELNPFPDEKLPFVLVPYLPVKREIYGEPDAELLEDNQKILGAVTRGMIDLLGRSANGQQGFAKGFLDPLNRRRFESGQDYEFNPSVPPTNGHITHKYPELPQSALAILQLQNQDAEALTGVKSFAGGLSGEAYGDVATAIRGVLDAASKREMAILRRLVKGLVQIGNKICAMNAVFLSEEEVVRVTNEEFVTIQREDLRGNFDLEVDISTAEIDNAQAQDLAFMLQTIGNTLDPSFTVMILAEIARLKKMTVLENKLRNWKPEPDPLEEARKQLEIEKLQAEVAKLAADAEYSRARARREESEADKKDLDFVEQETGTSHAREMEKQQAQSQGNQNLQVTKALTTPRKEGERDPDIEAAVGFNQLSRMTDGGEEINNLSELV